MVVGRVRGTSVVDGGGTQRCVDTSLAFFQRTRPATAGEMRLDGEQMRYTSVSSFYMFKMFPVSVRKHERHQTQAPNSSAGSLTEHVCAIVY